MTVAPVAPVAPEIPEPDAHPFEQMVYVASLEGISQGYVAFHVTPAAIYKNAHRTYDWMKEIGFGEDSWTREVMFSFAAYSFGVDYSVFYDAWLTEKPVAIPA